MTIDKTGQVYDLGAGTVQVIGLAEVGPPTTGEPDRTYDAEDHDNYFDIILKGDQAAIRLLQSVEIPTSTEPGYSDIYNPGGPGRTPIPGVIYTEPAAPQTFAINQALDESGTVSYASQDFANYDLDDDLPVVFWLNDSSGPGRLTASSNETNSLLAAGLTLKSIPFANEAARPGVSDIDAFFNSVTGDRIYTLDAVESLQLASSDAWQHIGRVFGAFDRSWPGAEPVYRFLDSTTGWHVFSPNLNDALQTEGIEYQDIGWYAASFVPVPQEVRFDRSDELLVTDALASGGMLSINGSGMLRLEAGGSFTQGIIIRDGRLQVNGSLSGGPLTVERDGVLSGKGVISNEVTVSGRLAPGQSPGTMTFLSSVDMAVDGVLEIEVDGPLPVDGPGGYDRVIVVGAENHFGTAGILDVRLRDISPPATNSFTPHVGQRIRGVITSNGSVTGSFASLSQPTDGLLPGTRLDTLYHTASVDLVVTPQSYGDLAALGMTQTVNQAAVGSALDTIRPVAGVRPSGAAAELFPALAPLGADQIAPALDSLAGQIHADVLDAALAGQRLLQSVVVTRMAGFNLDSAVNKSGHIGWMQALGRRVDQRTSDGVSGYKALSQGAAVGIDGSPVPGTSLGVSFGELASEVTSGSDRTDINAIFAAAYGVHHFDNIRLSSHLLGSFDEYQSYRAVQIGTLNSIPSGNSDGWSFNTGTSVGRVMRLSDVCTIEPVTSMTYFRVKRNAFQESTGDSEALSVFDSSRASLRSRIGATLAYVRPRLAGTASLGWNHE